MTHSRKTLITSALPCINGIKHLGNLAGSLLPADIHARYPRQIGDDVLFICATNEHGTPAELAAAEAGLPVAVYCAQHGQRLANLRSHHDERMLRKAADEVRAIWSVANAYLVSGVPWSHVVREPDRAAVVVRTSVNLLALAAPVAWPFIPATAERVLEALGSNAKPSWPSSAAEALALIEGGRKVDVPPILFEKLSAEWVETNSLPE